MTPRTKKIIYILLAIAALALGWMLLDMEIVTIHPWGLILYR